MQKCSLALTVRKLCSGASGDRQYSLLGGAPVSKDTSKRQCCRSLEHLVLCWRTRAYVAPMLLLGHLQPQGSKQVKGACTRAEQIQFLCAFSFAIFRLINYAELFAHPLPIVFPLYG